MLNGARLYHLKGHQAEVRFIDFSRKLQVLVSFDRDNLLKIHSFQGAEEPVLVQSIGLGVQSFNAMTVG